MRPLGLGYEKYDVFPNYCNENKLWLLWKFTIQT
jgi:hypothetical protein